MPKLSVIMPVYNAKEYLDMSIKSFMEQNMEETELICVNDGSTDNSENIIKRYVEENDSIKYIFQENSGSAIARNSALKEAKGEYIAFLDADDKFMDKTALKQMYTLAVKTDADIVAGNLKRIKVDGSIEENYDYENTLFAYFREEKTISPEEYGIPWAFYKNIYRRKFLEDNNITFPDLKRGQDPVFLAKALTHVERIETIPVDLYAYNHSASGGVNIKVNTPEKKDDYIEHFIQTFKILKENNFNKALNEYKNEFINYLLFQENFFDESIRNTLTQKEELDNFFGEDDYGYLVIDAMKNPVEDTDDEYNIIKDCLFEESLIEDVFVDVNSLNKFMEISKQNSYDSRKSSLELLKKIDNRSFIEKRDTLREIGKLKNEIKYYIKTNNAVLTSNSWKLTSFLRSLKHKVVR